MQQCLELHNPFPLASAALLEQKGLGKAQCGEERTPMRTNQSGSVKVAADRVIKDIRRATHQRALAKYKIKIMLDGLCDEQGIAELCRKECVVTSVFCRWSKKFKGERRLAGATARAAKPTCLHGFGMDSCDLRF